MAFSFYTTNQKLCEILFNGVCNRIHKIYMKAPLKFYSITANARFATSAYLSKLK